MKTFFDGIRSVDARVALCLVYTAVVLTTMEYFLLPVRVEQRLQGAVQPWQQVSPSLQAGAVWAGSCIVGFLIIPLLITLFVHREGPASIGFRFRGLARHLWIYGVLYLLMLPAILMAAERPDFLRVYPFVSEAKTRLDTFIKWEIAYLAQFVALEAFFRGYVLFTLDRRMGWNAAFVMAVPYGMIHWHKPPLEAFGAVIAGVILGFLALRLRSWLGGALLHGMVALTMDSLAAHRAGLL